MSDEEQIDAINGLGRAVMVCIAHLQHSNDGTAVMTYQIELEGGKVETYEITVKPAPPLVLQPTTITRH